MATDPRQRLARLGLPLGLVALAFVLAGAIRLVVLLVRDLGQLYDVGGAVVADRMSQLKPWPWKAPLMLVWIGALVVVVVACAGASWWAAIRRWRAR